MIRQSLGENFTEVTLLHMALTEKEMVPLREVATALDEWKPGRRESGYFKLNLRTALDPALNEGRQPRDAVLVAAWDGVLEMRRELERHVKQSVSDHWDAYLLFYPSGSYIGWHKDRAPFKKEHVRLNVVIQGDEKSGHFNVRDESKEERSVRIPVGSGVVFSPSKISHSVDMVEGKRLVLSIGALY